MSNFANKELNKNSIGKHTNHYQDDFNISPRKRSRPSLSKRLGLSDDSDKSDDETYSPSDEIVKNNPTSPFLTESKSLSSGETSKDILDLLKYDDEEEEEEEDRQEEAYSPSQLDPAMMEEVSHQLKIKEHASGTNNKAKVYIPPSMNFVQKDMDYREKRKSNETLNLHCRLIPIHIECTNIIDPRLRIHSTRLRLKVRQLVLDRLSKKNSFNKNEILEEIDHLVESHGRRFYWYRVICFLQNISLTTNSPKQVHHYLKELSRLLVLTPNISKILKIKQKYPKLIPVESSNINNNDGNSCDPRSNQFKPRATQMKWIYYNQ